MVTILLIVAVVLVTAAELVTEMRQDFMNTRLETRPDGPNVRMPGACGDAEASALSPMRGTERESVAEAGNGSLLLPLRRGTDV